MRKLGGRYRLDQLLGSGGMAVVWRGFDLVLGRPVAVKVLASDILVDRDSHERLWVEAHSAAQLSHPNVAEVYDFGRAGRGRHRTPYIVMELVEGPTLAQLLRNGKNLHWHAAARICAQVAAALAAAHARGVVHQDVKPANIMVPSGGVKVVDFGIAVAAGSSQVDQNGMLIGTPMYMAPERLRGLPAGPEGDVYSLGLVMYHCLTGAVPWPFESATGAINANLGLAPPRLPAVPGMPEVIAEICLRCLSKHPAGRPTSLAVATRLAEAAGVQVTAPLTASFQVPVPPRVPAGTAMSHALASTATGPAQTGDTATLDGSTRSFGRGHRRLRRVALTASVSAVGAVMAIPMLSGAQRRDPFEETPSPTPPVPQRSCTVDYLAQHERDGSFTAKIRLRNLGSQTLHGWTVDLRLADGQQIDADPATPWQQQGTEASLSGSGDLDPDGELNLPLNGRFRGTPAAPGAFRLAGVDCQRVTANLQTVVTPSPTGQKEMTDRSVRHSSRTPRGAQSDDSATASPSPTESASEPVPSPSALPPSSPPPWPSGDPPPRPSPTPPASRQQSGLDRLVG